MGGQGHKKDAKAAEDGAGNADNTRYSMNEDFEPARAVVAVLPGNDGAVAVAAGARIAVFDRRTGQSFELAVPSPPEGDQAGASSAAAAAIVRAVALSRCGAQLVAGGDDKCARIWQRNDDSNTWSLVKTIRSPKKISAVGFTADGRAALAANKFGDVLVTSTAPDPTVSDPSHPSPCELFLGHYCTVLTSLAINRSGRLLATTDREGKVRVSVVPDTPTDGAHEIQTYCFGHDEFVTWATFVCQVEDDGSELEVLVTGGGDGTMRMWDPMDGRQLCMIQLTPAAIDAQAKVGLVAGAVVAGGKRLVVAVDGQAELRVLSVDIRGKILREEGRYAIPGVPQPTDVATDDEGLVWAVSGPLSGTEGGVAISVASIQEDNGALQGIEDEKVGLGAAARRVL